MKRSSAFAFIAAASLALLPACSPEALSNKTAIDYWLWDANQLPGYEKCSQKFMEQNPDIEVRITQMGWNDYWTKLTAAFVAESGPDVFTDHVARYPEFQQRGVLMPLDDLSAMKDFKSSDYMEGLAEMWIGPDGKRYGVPKDYDTVAIMYDNKRLAEAGITPEQLAKATWNPKDGGTFEKIIAHLSVDKNGKRGDEPGFDPKNVATYGLAADPTIDYIGQTNWSVFALSTGWTPTDKPVWGTKFNYDDQRFKDSITWYTGLTKKGFLPSYGEFGEASPADQQFGSGRAAIAMTGSWMINAYSRLDGIDLGIAPLPSGPIGHPMSIFNGLGDSISAQTSKPEEAAKWVAFLGSDACQNIIGEQGVVFPARPAGTQAAIEAFAKRGLDVTPFTDRVKNGETVRYPLTYNGNAIFSVLRPAFDSIWLGQMDADGFDSYNEQVTKLMTK